MLENLKITSTDLVDAGANPDAHIRLFKRDDIPDKGVIQKIAATIANGIAGLFGSSESNSQESAVEKSARTYDEEQEREKKREISYEMYHFCDMFDDSLRSIIFDDDLDADGRKEKMLQSLDEFTAFMRSAIPAWASIRSTSAAETVAKSETQKAVFGEKIAKHVKAVESGGAMVADNSKSMAASNPIKKKEEIDTMKIDKSKLTPEELISFEALEKKYGITETDATPPASGSVEKSETSTTAPPELHPDVKKALDDNKAMATKMEELQKSLEIKDLELMAKKYEVIGKKTDELAPKLHELMKAGGTVYSDYVALLDEQVTLVEKSGLFTEIGSGRSMMGVGSGGELNAKVAEVRKGTPSMTEAEAFVKAYEENPVLAVQYEQEYAKRSVN